MAKQDIILRKTPTRKKQGGAISSYPTFRVTGVTFRVNISRHSKFIKLMKVTARILAMYQIRPKASLNNAITAPTKKDLGNATFFWIRDAQDLIRQEVQDGKHQRLCPKTLPNGIIGLGGRAER